MDLIKCTNCFYWDPDNSCTWEEYFDVPIWVKLTLPGKPLEVEYAALLNPMWPPSHIG